MERVLVTGAAGFIGSHLTDHLLEQGYEVIGVDNLSAGTLNNLSNALRNRRFRFVKSDLVKNDDWIDLAKESSIIFHYAANPEVRHSVKEPMSHFTQNLVATMKVLETARKGSTELIVFASSSTVYGDPEVIPTPEDHPLKPISVYGATKASAEILCQTYARLYGFKCLVLRYANIIGPRLRHGVIYDFIEKLSKNPKVLEILGDGTQRKSYLWIGDSIEATLGLAYHALKSKESSLVYNVGNEDWITVRDIADIVVRSLGLRNVRYIFKPGTPDGRGWPGDVKLMLLDISKIKSDVSWRPKYSSKEAVEMTAKELAREVNIH